MKNTLEFNESQFQIAQAALARAHNEICTALDVVAETDHSELGTGDILALLKKLANETSHTAKMVGTYARLCRDRIDHPDPFEGLTS